MNGGNPSLTSKSLFLEHDSQKRGMPLEVCGKGEAVFGGSLFSTEQTQREMEVGNHLGLVSFTPLKVKHLYGRSPPSNTSPHPYGNKRVFEGFPIPFSESQAAQGRRRARECPRQPGEVLTQSCTP